MLKKLFHLCMAITLLATMLAIPVSVKANDEMRNIVLVLDESGPTSFTSGGKTIYTANSAVEYVKDAAKKFINNTLQSGGNQQVAVVSYHKSATVQQNFTNDKQSLLDAVDKLYAHDKNATSITAGLEKANYLLQNAVGEKNVVIFSTGFSNQGNHLDNGHYNSDTVGSNWYNTSTNIHLYKYANYAHTIADEIKQYAKIYSVGLFQTMEGMPQKGQNIAEFFRLFAKDLASSPDYFYLVEDLGELNSTFEIVAEDIQLNPSIWAKGEIKEAKELGLIPETLEGQDLSKKITRGEFAAVSLELYEALSGQTVDSADSPFRDIAGNINEDSIEKAYVLNIVLGVSDDEFWPEVHISREDLASMLCRTIKKNKFEDWSLDTDDEYYLDSEGVKKYADDADISAYAKPSVYYLTKMGILKGVSETHFAPKNTTTEEEAIGYATATREQAIALSLRIFKISDFLAVS